MWSLIFCLLSSLVASVATTADYCDISNRPGCYGGENLCECDNKETAEAKEDIEWTMANAFDNRKIVSEEPGVLSVTLDMHRALYVQTTSTDSTVTFKIIKSPCKQLYYRIDDIFYIEKIDTIINIGKHKKAVFAIVEPECELSVLKDIFKDSKLYHIFLRSQKTVKINSMIKTKSDLGTLILSSQKFENEENIPSVSLQYNAIFPFDSDLYRDDNKRKECYNMCKLGTIIEFELTDGLSFANTFKMIDTCEWMTVHLNNEAMQESAEISLRHGFVTLPHELKAFSIDFEKAEPISATGYEVTVAYYLTSKKDNNNKDIHTSHMIIWNAHGRSVRTKQLHGSTPKIVFAFSNDNCLSAPIGDFEAGEEKFPFDKSLNLGYRAASVIQYHGWRYIHNTDGIVGPEEYFGNGVSKDIEKEEGTQTDFKDNAAASTTTPEPIDTNVIGSQDPEVIWHSFNQSEINNKKKEEQEKAKTAFQNAIKKDVYLYWAIPAGFCSGSFSSFIIGNIILFFFKRTVMNFWYKAMYKRYGSDTTMGAGTTMGKTGAGETIGGSTTVGGGTTMGGTTAGETGSTTAA